MDQLCKNEHLFAISMLFLENTFTNPEKFGLSSRSLDSWTRWTTQQATHTSQFKVQNTRQFHINLKSTFYFPNFQYGRKFLIDAGADVSFIPASTINRRFTSPSKSSLFAAKCSVIRTYGTTRPSLILGYVVHTHGILILLIPHNHIWDQVFCNNSTFSSTLSGGS